MLDGPVPVDARDFHLPALLRAEEREGGVVVGRGERGQALFEKDREGDEVTPTLFDTGRLSGAATVEHRSVPHDDALDGVSQRVGEGCGHGSHLSCPGRNATGGRAVRRR